VTALDLLNTNVPGKVTENGVRANVSALLSYVSAWLGGLGCVPISNLMEDAATAEIARAQLWNWVKHGATTANGKKVSRGNLARRGAETDDAILQVTAQYVDGVIKEETEKAKKGAFSSTVDIAGQYLSSQVHADMLSDFLTTDLYPHLSAEAAPTRPRL
jgi:malate synthase